MSDVQVFYEPTPNPQSMKFVVTQPIAEESVQFENMAEADRSPLATKLFGFPWAAGVFIGPNFVTVTKQDWVDWETLADPLSNLIEEHIASGQPILLKPKPSTTSQTNEDDSPLVAQIKTTLDTEIRPAVAMDGGDIIFGKYEDQVLYLYMQGACSGCPSSMITLKQGIEARMQELYPEIKEVVAL